MNILSRLLSSPGRRALMGACVVVSVAVLTACAGGGDARTRVSPVATAPLGLQATQAREQVPEAGDWWTALDDPVLSRLLEHALAEGPTVQGVIARLESAQAQAQAAGANTGPRVDLTADVTREHFTTNGIYPPPLGGAMYTMGDLQLGGSWELDLFGRTRSRLKAAIGAERAQWADGQAARLMLTTTIARDYIRLAQLLAQREVAQRSLAQRQEIFDLVRQRVRAGIDTNVEFYQGQEALPEMRQQIEGLNEQIALTRHRLAMLSALPLQELDGVSPALAAHPWFRLPERLPADLLSRRADVQASLWRVQAATHEMAAAKADFYPDINLMAFAGYSTIGFQRLFHSDSRQYGWGPAIHLPVFDAGRLRAQLRGSAADLDSAVAAYNQNVLDALRDTADQLSTLQSLARQQQEQNDAQSSALQAYDLAVQRYRAGLGGYLNVLQAETTILAQRRLHADLQARVQDSSIALVNALGGWPRDLSLPGYAVAATAASSAPLAPLTPKP